MREEIKNHKRQLIFLITVGIVLIVSYKALDSLGYIGMCISNFFKVISPFLVGLFMAYLLYIPERKIEEIFSNFKWNFIRKSKRKLGILLTYIIFIVLIVIIINFIVPILSESVNELISNTQSYYNKAIETYSNLPDDSIFKTEQIYTTLKELQNFDFKQYVSIDKITVYLKSVVGLARGIFDVFVAIVVSIYILSERDDIFAFFKRLSKAVFNEKINKYIENYFYKSNGVFFKFISSQFIDAIIVGILAVISLKIIGVKYSSLLGFTIGLFNMIPYFGAIIAIAFAAIITLITAGISKAILLLVVIVVLQQIDANIINPKIIGDSLKISPLIVILSVTVGGAYWGIVGMFLSVPIAAVLKILVNDYIESKIEKE